MFFKMSSRSCPCIHLLSVFYETVSRQGTCCGEKDQGDGFRLLLLQAFSWRAKGNFELTCSPGQLMRIMPDRALKTKPWVEVKYICLKLPTSCYRCPRRVRRDATATMRLEILAQSFSIRDYILCR